MRVRDSQYVRETPLIAKMFQTVILLHCGENIRQKLQKKKKKKKNIDDLEISKISNY